MCEAVFDWYDFRMCRRWFGAFFKDLICSLHFCFGVFWMFFQKCVSFDITVPRSSRKSNNNSNNNNNNNNNNNKLDISDLEGVGKRGEERQHQMFFCKELCQNKITKTNGNGKSHYMSCLAMDFWWNPFQAGCANFFLASQQEIFGLSI